MKRIGLLAALSVVYLMPSALLAAGINYRERWDSYASGTADTTYTSVWTSAGGASYPTVKDGASAAVSSSGATGDNLGDALEIDSGKTRLLTNSLVDGVSNVLLQPANPLATGTEMSAGQVLKPLAQAQGTATNLTMYYYYCTSSSNADRTNTGTFAELSYNAQHAPLSGSAGSVIPVLALGKKQGDNGPSFFNGLTWTTFGTAPVGGNKVFLSLQIFNAAGVWKVEAGESINGAAATFSTFNLATGYDPTALGFNTVSWEYNANSSVKLNDGLGDDIILGGYNSAVKNPPNSEGGIIVNAPEPAALVMLSLGGLMLRRRRR